MGKIVGGTAMLNNMIYVRGHPEDFAIWYKDKPDFDYNFDILPYFKKVENSVVVSNIPFLSNLSHHIMQSANCANFPINDGVDVEHAIPGFSYPKATIFNGRRWTSWHQLADLKRKYNLAVITNSIVEKILFRSNYEAYGVRYSHLDEYYTVKASKGVILAAGVVGTPKILMLSGIGSSQHLKKMKIDPIIDLPVGNNLQDHVTTGLDLILLDSPVDVGIEQMISPYSAFNYFFKSKGSWTTTGCENLAFFASDPQKAPDLQFMVLPVGVTIDNGTFLKSLVGISDKTWDRYFSSIKKRAFTILPIVLHPRSRGTIRLRDKNPKSPPLIDPNYLSDGYDVEVMLRGIEEIKKFLQIAPMQNIGATLYDKTFPGCEKFQFDTRPYWECYVRHLTITSYHPVGTCKLGEVVDYEFQVKGTSRLYVSDGSILPLLPSGNPNGPIMMMAEKAADVIKGHRWLAEKKTH
ncbi:glucose dehydrogenase [FAD, quinone]-like, partial [Asbolus verrucosus]